MLEILLYIVAGWLTFGALAAVGTVGKLRKPMTPGMAASIVAVQAAVVTVIVLAALELP